MKDDYLFSRYDNIHGDEDILMEYELNYDDEENDDGEEES